MKLLRLLPLALLLGAVSGTPADDKQEKAPAAILKLTPEQLLKLWDKNQNGYVDKEELPGQIQPMFDRLDQNGDASSIKKELGQLLEILKKRRQDDDARQQAKLKGKSKGTGADTELQVNALLQRLDSNKDARSAESEADGRPLARAFDSLDTNKDGYLDRTELANWCKRVGKAGANKGPKAQQAAENVVRTSTFDFDALDKDADGRLTLDELAGNDLAELSTRSTRTRTAKSTRRNSKAYIRKMDDSVKADRPKVTR